MARPHIINNTLVYRVRLRKSISGIQMTIPVEVAKTLEWKVRDSMAIVLLDDGIVVSKIEES